MTTTFSPPLLSAPRWPPLPGRASPLLPGADWLRRSGDVLSLTSAGGWPCAATRGLASYSMRDSPAGLSPGVGQLMDVKYYVQYVHIPDRPRPSAPRAAGGRSKRPASTIMGASALLPSKRPPPIKNEFEYAKNAGSPLIYVDPTRPRSTPPRAMRRLRIKSPSQCTVPREQELAAPAGCVRARVGSRAQRWCASTSAHRCAPGTDPVAAAASAGDGLYDMHSGISPRRLKESACRVGALLIDFPGLFRS